MYNETGNIPTDADFKQNFPPHYTTLKPASKAAVPPKAAAAPPKPLSTGDAITGSKRPRESGDVIDFMGKALPKKLVKAALGATIEFLQAIDDAVDKM